MTATRDAITANQEDIARRLESLATHVRAGTVDGVLLVATFTQGDPAATTIVGHHTDEADRMAPYAVYAKLLGWMDALRVKVTHIMYHGAITPNAEAFQQYMLDARLTPPRKMDS